ncbi:hypothetical protein BT93_C0593 [Corymbia citriodora subsp. variegata]|nr:hypothetical protein BT93_C0593 [Corymbia citriodora subsp. variegata]
MSRMQIAADVAHGLDCIHDNTGLNMIFVHNLLKRSSIAVMKPSFKPKICHFEIAQMCGEADKNNVLREQEGSVEGGGEIKEEGVGNLTLLLLESP